MRHMIDSTDEIGGKHFTIRRNPADRYTTEVNTVVPSVPAYQPGAVFMTLQSLEGERNFQCRINRFRARVGKKATAKTLRRELGELLS